MRRRAVVLVATLVLVGAGCDWPMFRRGPDHSAVSDDTSISAGALRSGAVLQTWSATTGDAIFSSPAVAGGVVYVGSNDGTLYAFDAAAGDATCTGTPPSRTCTPLWTAATGGSVESSPAVVAGVVYVGSDDKKLYAFDAAGGNARCTGTAPARRCTPLWTATTTNIIVSSPVVDNGIVYVGSTDNNLYAFDASGGNANCTGAAPARTCTPLWRATTGSGIRSSPALAGNVVYVASQDRNLYAFDATGGSGNCTGTAPARICTPLWTAPTSGIVISSPAVAGGVVYVGSDDGMLYAFDAAGRDATCTGTQSRTCSPLWKARTGLGIESSPAVANGVVYVGSDDLKIYAFDAAGASANCTGASPNRTCTPLWSAATGDIVLSSPAVANDVVYVGSTDHKLYAFDATGGDASCTGTAPARTCNPLWSMSTGGVVRSSPSVANGAVYVGSDDHTLYAFGLDKIPPTTSVLQPSSNATVSGTTTLVASASDNVGVAKVEFHLTGGSFQDALIGTAVAYYGWDYDWNTTTVPNGVYTLTSVAYDRAGNVGRSAGVTISVKN